MSQEMHPSEVKLTKENINQLAEEAEKLGVAHRFALSEQMNRQSFTGG